jgi:hypothetical protein
MATTRVSQGGLCHTLAPTLRFGRPQLTKFPTTNGPNVKYYGLLVFALAACSQQQHPVILAPVRMDVPSPESSGVSRQARAPFDTQRDDPFATTNRIDWPGPNRYRSSDGTPGPDYWQQRADYTVDW